MNPTRDAGGPVVLDVTHDTRYRYSSEVALAHHLAYLKPCDTPHQQLERFALDVVPTPTHRRVSTDSFGNARLHFSHETPHVRLLVRARSRVRLRPRFTHLDVESTLPWNEVADRMPYRAKSKVWPETDFTFASPFIPRHRELGNYASTSFTAGRPVAVGAADLMRRIHRDFRYVSDSTEISTPVLEAFAARRGVCQDFAHIMIGGLRAMGLPARYVSGYLLTQPPPGKPRLIGADASHAWVSVWCPTSNDDGCWVDFDPTNDVLPSTSHVTLAMGRDFGDVSPLRGIIRGGGEHALSVGVTVQPVD